jgi:hypothetical protein
MVVAKDPQNRPDYERDVDSHHVCQVSADGAQSGSST